MISLAYENNSEELSNLCGQLSYSSPSIVSDAIFKIGCLEKKAISAIPLLIELCGSPFDTVRVSATAALGRINSQPRRCVPVLIELLQDQSVEVQRRAAASIGLIDGRDIRYCKVEGYLDFVYEHNKDYYVRHFLADTLSRMKKKDVSAENTRVH